MAEESFKQSLPQSYKYSVEMFEGTAEDFLAVVHVNLTTIQEADVWVRCFERATKTNWNVRKTYPQLEKLLRKDYVCHMHNFHNRPLKGRKSQSRFKFTGCPADLIIKIKPVTKSTLFRYKWVRDGMPAKIIINFRHNHAVVSSETLSFRRLDPAVRQMFAGYFELGMSAAAAAKYHRQRLETDPNIGNPAIALEDAARNPRRTTVSYLYTLWRESKLKEATTKESDDEPMAVGKWYNEDALENDVKDSVDEAESAKTLTTTDAWQVLATKIDKRLKQLAPRDKDVLNAISVMTERFEQIKTHKELIAFLQSASTSALHPSSSSLSSGPVIQDGMTNVAIGPAALAVEPTMDVVMTPLAARRKQSRPKRSNNKRVANTPMCVVMHAESFDPASVPVKRLCGVAQHVDNSVSVTNTMPINIMPANLPCFSGAADYQTNHAAYLQTNGWDYL